MTVNKIPYGHIGLFRPLRVSPGDEVELPEDGKFLTPKGLIRVDESFGKVVLPMECLLWLGYPNPKVSGQRAHYSVAEVRAQCFTLYYGGIAEFEIPGYGLCTLSRPEHGD